MYTKTRGIVIRTIKVSDSGSVITIYTEDLGLQSFFVKGLRSRKSKSKSAYFQPLTILNIVLSPSTNNSLQTFKDIELHYNYKSATSNITKSTQIFFLNELLYKVLKEETANANLFVWIVDSLKWLDISEKAMVNFHIIFMIQLTKFLGFYPVISESNHKVFDMQEGNFTDLSPVHPNYISGTIVPKISALMKCNYEDSANISISNKERKEILDILISYYNLHHPSMGKFNSIDVLSAVLD